MSLLGIARYAVRTSQFDQQARWSPRGIGWLQRRRLRALLELAVRQSPFYRDKFRGLDVGRVPLAELPTTTKEEMAVRFDEVVTDPAVRHDDLIQFIADPDNLGKWYGGRYAVSHTSGSQGRPLTIVQDRRALEILFALTSARGNSGPRPGVLEGIRRLREPARVAVVALRRGFYPSGAAFEFLPEIAGPFIDLRWFSSAQLNLVEELHKFQPHTLVAYASVLLALATQARALNLVKLRQVANSSEQLTDAAREHVGTAFNVPVLDHYGVGECLVLSDGCPTDGGAHVNADWAILEVVDERNQPVLPGEFGHKVLVTNLANRVQPFIRYEIGDRVAMATEPCRCGNRLPRIARIDGRTAELFWVGDERRPQMISGAVFHSALDATGAIREWQAVQVDRNRIELRLNLLAPAMQLGDELHRKILHELHEFGLPSRVQVEPAVVPPITPDPRTGKLRRMLPYQSASEPGTRGVAAH